MPIMILPEIRILPIRSFLKLALAQLFSDIRCFPLLIYLIYPTLLGPQREGRDAPAAFCWAFPGQQKRAADTAAFVKTNSNWATYIVISPSHRNRLAQWSGGQTYGDKS